MAITWTYVAGLFDGEGSVGIYSVSNGRSKEKLYWAPKLTITGSYRPMIEAVARFVGIGRFTFSKRQALGSCNGRKYATRKRRGAKLCKQGWRWSVSSQADILVVGAKLLPFLHEKKAQLEAVLQFCRGELDGKVAAARCKKAKKFSFPADDWIEPNRRKPAFKGENNPFALLSNSQVRDLRRRAIKGESTLSLMKRFNIKDRGTVWRIKTKRAYAEVT